MTRLLPLLLALVTWPAPAFTGSEACADCHAEAFRQWQGSHHDLAMQLPDEHTVLGDFDDAEFSYNGITTRFFRREGRYVVRTDGEDGELHDFEVAYVFGVYPLQQYLLPLDRGRLQALSIAWDARPAAAGGQRWYHLYPDEAIDHQDPLHWTGPYQNWNTRCAECHSTDLHKNYRAASRSFETRYAEVDVGCEACHGPGEEHARLARAGALAGASRGGFDTDLAQRGDWAFAAGQAIASRREPLSGRAQVDACGRCHSRRATLGEYRYGHALSDTHRVSLPLAPLYHHDGQILDEVYVYGSFLQSKMQQRGVVCSNCHEPHSLALRAPGNGVCAQCHQPEVYDRETHHHHPKGGPGAACVDCHMPETTYMGVDPRRDHSLRIPRPDLTIVLGTPNACNSCHTDQSPRWALDALRRQGVNFRDTGRHPARAFQQAANGDSRALPTLARLAADDHAAPIWRASAMTRLGQFGGRETLDSARQLLVADDPLLRASAAGALDFLPAAQRYLALRPLVRDDDTSVRLAVAEALADVPLDQLPEAEADALRSLFREYTDIKADHADMPSVQLQLGVFLLARGDLPGAEAACREALVLNPQLVPAYLNLGDLLRAAGREQEARDVLLQALLIAPEHGPALHALGLLETRAGNRARALDYLGRAAALETGGTRHRFVYAIALHDLGQPEQALVQLKSLLRLAPRDEQVLLALANYSAELGQRSEAREYARNLTGLAPGNSAYQQLLQQLSGP